MALFLYKLLPGSVSLHVAMSDSRCSALPVSMSPDPMLGIIMEKQSIPFYLL